MQDLDEQPASERILIVAPTRRDADVTCALLRGAQLHCVACPDMQALTEELAGGVGVVVMTGSALVDPSIDAFLCAMTQQPSWSDVPIVMLTRLREGAPSIPALEILTNVTLLDLPVSTRSMVSAVLASLRARRRQYQIRDQMVAQAKTEELLRDADRRKDQFLATLSHELRNPLAPIRTGLHVLSRFPGDAAQSVRMRTIMERQVGQMVKLIDELLDLSRIAMGRVVLHRERVDLRTVAEAALEASQPAIEAAQHQIRLEVPDLPVWVVGDASRLTQALGNLIGNAAKYTPSGGAIEVVVLQQPGHAIARVSDNGTGIPADMVHVVFDMFTQVHRTLDRSQGGLGIGLSLVRSLVELHGGTVRAASPGPNCGSTFTITLPAVQYAELPAEREARDHGPHRRLRALVVDDNVDAADSLAMLLQASGHETRTAYNGTDVLPTAARFHPEVVFCDIGMPDMDGNEVAARMRSDRRYAAAVLVAISGWGSEDDKRRARSAGFDFHMVKPVSAEAIEALLSRL